MDDYVVMLLCKVKCFAHNAVGKLPASQANGEVVSAYRREEKEKMKKLLRTYFNICFKAKVSSIFMSCT